MDSDGGVLANHDLPRCLIRPRSYRLAMSLGAAHQVQSSPLPRASRIACCGNSSAAADTSKLVYLLQEYCAIRTKRASSSRWHVGGPTERASTQNSNPDSSREGPEEKNC